MAKRRMFSLDIVDTDDFLDMPVSAQSLYFHLGMRADDDGFVSSPRKITKIVNCGVDDFNILIAKGYVIPFDSGVCVVRDWKAHNYIKSDRYRPTRYTAEKALLKEAENGQYFLPDTECIQHGSNVVPSCLHDGAKADPQVRVRDMVIDRDRLGEEIKGSLEGSSEVPVSTEFSTGFSTEDVFYSPQDASDFEAKRARALAMIGAQP